VSDRAPLPAPRVLISEEQIRQRVAELGAEISAYYKVGPLYLIGILKGSFAFLADLSRSITTPCRIEFIGISSYGANKTTSGQVRLTRDLDVSVEGRDVLIVEDIVDSGVTLDYLIRLLQQRQPRSIRVVAMLDKPERRQRPVEIAWTGFQIPDHFVVGYGLDYAEDYRNLRDICLLDDVPSA
jgi:hypoxanthine phosphoribosyltransferase